MSDNIAIITAEQMNELIYVIRGQKVMLDVYLAKIYGYETKNFNRQVKNNIEKFPSDFMFQLTKEEALRCKNFTLNEKGDMRGQHIKYLPFAFTEHKKAKIRKSWLLSRSSYTFVWIKLAYKLAKLNCV